MKRMYFSLLAALALAAGSAAQSAPVPSSDTQHGTASAQGAAVPGQSSNQIPSGTIVAVELSKSVDAKKAKVGDKIEAKLPADVLSHGKVAIPRNTKIIGHVTEVKAHSKESPDSRVGIAIDRMVMKDGREVPIEAAVQAIGRPLLSAALSSTTMSDAGMPGGGARPTGGSPMDSPMPSRSPERVASIPPTADAGSDTSSPDGGTIAPLGPTSQGVVGMKGLSLKSSGQTSVVSSETDNVHLDSGTQLILRTQ